MPRKARARSTFGSRLERAQARTDEIASTLAAGHSGARSNETLRNSVEQERLALQRRRAAEARGGGDQGSWLDDHVGKPGGGAGARQQA